MDNLIQANFLPNQMETFSIIPDFYAKFQELATDPVPVATVLNTRTDVEKKLGFNAPPILDNFVPNLELAAVERNLVRENINEYASPRVENRQQQNDPTFQYSPISDAGTPPPHQSLVSLIVQEVLQLEEQQEMMNTSLSDSTNLSVHANPTNFFVQCPQEQINTVYSPISNGESPQPHQDVESLIVQEVLKLEEEQQRNVMNSSVFEAMNPAQGNSMNFPLQNVPYPQQKTTAMHSPISDPTWPPAQESSTQQQIPPPANNTNWRRSRSTYTPSQVHQMEKYYRSKGCYVTKLEREKLAEELHLHPQQVKVWFQNRRAKQRRIDGVCANQRNPEYYPGQCPFIQNISQERYSNEKSPLSLEMLSSDDDIAPLQVPDFDVFD